MAVARDRLGRPTQLHGIPFEERAIDANGNRLPWAYDYPDDHPQARYQKRQPEEKGAFGKTSRRMGSSRATRTQTPAKKENPTIDGFAAALKYDQQLRETNNQQPNNHSTSNPDTTNASLVSTPREPQQVLLYGFASEFQWSAISFYERVSGGLICEDYPRDPPAEKRRYNNGLGAGSKPIRRTLTQAERILASQYHGGESWIVVTFDSREAADRAIAASPHSVNGYWAFAEPWRGLGPREDKPVPATEDAANARSKTMRNGPVFKAQEKRRQSSTLPKGFISSEAGEMRRDQAQDNVTETSTVTSATATGIDDNDQQLLRRRGDGNPQAGQDDSALTPMPKKTHFTHFPNTPRTMIKPAAEALLPQPSWWEGLLKSLAASGWIPGDMIGSSVPRKEDGSFDEDAASAYWRFWYWIDSIIGTDLCGLREE